MSGIKTVEEMNDYGLNKGFVLAKGDIVKSNLKNTKYLIVDFNDNGWETIYDYGLDVKFDENINVGDLIELKILDEYNALWLKTSM